MFDSFLGLLERESCSDDLLDVDLSRSDQSDSSWPSVFVSEEELDGNLVCGTVHEWEVEVRFSDSDDEDETSCLGGI